MDFIIVGILQDWNLDLGSNSKNIGLELSKNHRVLYVNKPLDRKTITNRKDDPLIKNHFQLISKKEDSLFKISENLWSYYPEQVHESLNWIPLTGLFLQLCKLNSNRLASDLSKVIDRLGFKDCIIFNDNEMFRTFYLKDYLNPKLYIYYSRDNLLGVPYWKKHGASIEPKHIAKADIALANSVYLANYCRRYNPKSFYIGQGCDLSIFSHAASYTVPAEFKNIKGPIIGYVGAIVSLRIDIHIISHIAQSRPDWNIVLVGPEDEAFAKSDLHHLSNVHFLGKKPITELPAYISTFDVCINPQLVNEVTIGNYPLKVDEYLAMGKPTVVTKTEATEIFENCVYIADKPEDYPRLIEQALKENSKELEQRRVEMAKSHTWENCIKQMLFAIDKTITT